MGYVKLVCKVFLCFFDCQFISFFEKCFVFDAESISRWMRIGCRLKRANQNVLTSILDRFRSGISAARAHHRFGGKLHMRHVNTMKR